MSDTLARSKALLAERTARVPARIAAASEAVTLPQLEAPHWTITGVGGSEGPARVLAHRLAEAGRAARFVPCSRFAVTGDDLAGGLVLFSQGLSPNARGALAPRHRFAPRVIVTTVTPNPEGSEVERFLAAQLAEGAHRIPHGPTQEGELLVRIEGPAEATVRAIQLAAHITGEAAPPLRAASALPDVAPLPELRLALVGAGDTPNWLHGQRWKLLEGLGLADPPVYDVMQIAHGPLQQFYEEPMVMLAVAQSTDEHPLFDRLARVLRPHHELRILTLEAPLPEGWPQLELWFDALLLATMKLRPRDLIAWPGKHADADLYALDPSRLG